MHRRARLTVVPLLALLTGPLGTLRARAEGALPETLTVEDAARIALENHPSLGAARAQQSAAAARTKQSWAPLLPGFTGLLAYQPQTANFAASPAFARALASGSSTPRTPTPNSAELFSFYQAQLGLTWIAFDFGRTWYAGLAAGESESTFDRATEATSLQVALDARVAFYNALAAAELVTVAEESVATQKRHLEQMRGFVDVGTRTRVDLAQARADEAAAELQLAQAHGQRETALAALHDALGMERWSEPALVAPADEAALALPAEAIDELVDEALAHRPEPRQIEAQARAADLQRRSIRGAWFPSLSLTMGPSFAGTQIDALAPNFNLSLQLGYPLLGMNPYLVLNQGREAEANVRVALEQARVARGRVRLETAQALATLRSAREAVQAAELLVQAAGERRELQSGRFEAGLGTVLELQDAEFAYVNARGQRVQAIFTARIAKARLHKALGR